MGEPGGTETRAIITTVCKGTLMNMGQRRLECELSKIKTFLMPSPSATLFTSPSPQVHQPSCSAVAVGNFGEETVRLCKGTAEIISWSTLTAAEPVPAGAAQVLTVSVVTYSISFAGHE